MADIFLHETTLEQAVLAAIVKEAHQLIQTKSAGYLGRTAMQKIPYFLRVCGVPLRYRFDVHHYGTFSQSILSDVEWLQVCGAVADTSRDQEKYSAYRVGPELNHVLESHSTELAPHNLTIREVVTALFPWEPRQLELVSTLDYVSRQLEGQGENVTRDEVIRRFKHFKGDKFNDSEIESTLGRMIEAKLVKAA